MKSANSYNMLDLEHDLPSTRKDILAMRRTRECRRMSFEDYLEFLGHFAPPGTAALGARKDPTGIEPFEL